MNRRWLYLAGILTVIAIYNLIGYRYFDGACWLAGRGVTGGVWSQEHLNWSMTLFHSGIILAVVLLAAGFFASLRVGPSFGDGNESDCPGCGRSASTDWSLCPYCGSDLGRGSNFGLEVGGGA